MIQLILLFCELILRVNMLLINFFISVSWKLKGNRAVNVRYK